MIKWSVASRYTSNLNRCYKYGASDDIFQLNFSVAVLINSFKASNKLLQLVTEKQQTQFSLNSGAM